MKYFFLLIFFLLCATPLCAEQTIDVMVQDLTNQVELLQESFTSSQQDFATQKDLIDKQQSQIDLLVNSENETHIEVSKIMETLLQLSDELQREVKKSEGLINMVDSQLSSLVVQAEQQSSLIQEQSERIDTLENLLNENKAAFKERIDGLEKVIDENKAEFTKMVETVGQGVTETKTQINTLGQDMGGKLKQQGYWVFVAALIGVFGIALGVVVRKKLSSSKNQLEGNLSSMRLEMEEENVKLDSKLLDLLQSQMKLSEASSATSDTGADATKIDHTLPLKVGEEIFRMRQRLSALPDDTKGLRPLMKSLERLEEGFISKGYELVDMLGKPFDDGLNVKARFVPSDEISPGERIINKIIKPQINYQGVSIQVADIEVITGG